MEKLIQKEIERLTYKKVYLNLFLSIKYLTKNENSLSELTNTSTKIRKDDSGVVEN